MDQDVKALAERLLQTGYNDLPAREQRVLRRMARRMAVSENINVSFNKHSSFGQRLSDQVAAFGGSWTFISLFCVALACWVLLNSVMLSRTAAFDPYPYIFLNLVLSMIAAIQAPIIMMSQNRQSAKDRLAAAHDYEVNLKAELEIMNLNEKLDDIRMRQLETVLERQSNQLDELHRLIERLDRAG